MTAAAMTGPTPNSPVRQVPAAWTAVASFFLVSRSWASMRRRSSRKAAASSQRAAATASGGVICEDPGRVRRVDRPAGTAGHQVTQHGVQPAYHLGPGPAQIPVALGPDLQHHRVIIGPDL